MKNRTLYIIIGILIIIAVVVVIFFNNRNQNSKIKTPSDAIKPPSGTTESSNTPFFDPFSSSFFAPADTTSSSDNSGSNQAPAPQTPTASLDDAFNPNFWKTLKTNGTYNPSYQDEQIAGVEATRIWNALGLFQINHPDVINEVFTNAKSKAFVSLISDKFVDVGRGGSLFEFLKVNLSKDQLKTAVGIVNGLPTV